ncbi:OmpA family protein [uncultured Cetobacterium sp.]|uniref:OmpA family protein n=1 Tax=uncultured Cetobacterium sp. TaxID=527638 RepID=UPI002603A77B|nr:OmpA family protein [uncultured Cetobacterium sp.]
MTNKKTIGILLLTSSLLGACSTVSVNNKTTGTAGGAAAGAVLGQLFGQDTKGTLIGAGIGALAGLGWGAYKDMQYNEFLAALRSTNITVTNNKDNLNLRLPGESSFKSSSAVLNSGFYGPLNSIAEILNKYQETKIQVSGYTDSTGNPNYNLNLSLERAQSVANYLAAEGVSTSRISSVGYGSKDPVASNETSEGRALNRRVEIKIFQGN